MGNIILGVGNAARLFHSDTGEGKGTEDLISIVDPGRMSSPPSILR